MTGYRFRAWWPIDSSVIRSPADLWRAAAEVAEPEVPRLAAEQGCRVVGELEWRAADGHLIAEGAAIPIPAQEAA